MLVLCIEMIMIASFNLTENDNSDINRCTPIIQKLICCILRGSSGEHIVDVVPGGTELGPRVKVGNWAGRTHSQ
jgi:hypothetical protein